MKNTEQKSYLQSFLALGVVSIMVAIPLTENIANKFIDTYYKNKKSFFKTIYDLIHPREHRLSKLVTSSEDEKKLIYKYTHCKLPKDNAALMTPLSDALKNNYNDLALKILNDISEPLWGEAFDNIRKSNNRIMCKEFLDNPKYQLTVNNVNHFDILKMTVRKEQAAILSILLEYPQFSKELQIEEQANSLLKICLINSKNDEAEVLLKNNILINPSFNKIIEESTRFFPDTTNPNLIKTIQSQSMYKSLQEKLVDKDSVKIKRKKI
jgi:hypothetical protein